MIGHEFEAGSGEELVQIVRALGQHRYVSSRLHLVHAFVLDSCAEATCPELTDAAAWARETLSDGSIDPSSKDERLYRRVTEGELEAILSTFWTTSDSRKRRAASARLVELLRGIGVEVVSNGAAAREPFDEEAEEDLFPVLIDAGWELLPLASLDAERHKGAIGAFGDDLAFDVARFEEENAVPKPVTLNELPAMGVFELLALLDESGAPRVPFVVWADGNETYVDYVLRGVRRAVDNRRQRSGRG